MPTVIFLTLFPLFALGAIFATLYWAQTLVEVIKTEPSANHHRLTWVLLLLSLQFPGALLYRYLQRRHSTPAPRPLKPVEDGFNLLY